MIVVIIIIIIKIIITIRSSEKGGGKEGIGPFKILSGRTGRYLNPLPLIFLIFFVNISAAVSLFPQLQNSTVGNKGTDAAGLEHVHHLVDLSQYIML